MIQKNQPENAPKSSAEDPGKSTHMTWLEYIQLYGAGHYSERSRDRLIDVLQGKVIPAERIGFLRFEEDDMGRKSDK